MKRKYCTATMLPFFMAFLFSMFMLQSGFSQEKTLSVSGKVTSAVDGIGIPKANITVQGGGIKMLHTNAYYNETM